ncbi:GGDEF domain-containing protein [Pontiella agarivorans]|uniref:diguanylate cyclase n=1 Tax=Pontiella agarivorans TaxID=3038953 RepID=A0ABU5MYW7_9BACT|nr:GGDEF domain-containing protein [Pontiella agarivorans]MDZ8119410.1 GGDEF domain-containing protein [Pontiella agarivorans]
MNHSENNPLLWLTILALTKQATRDWLTGLYNRRYFEETLNDHLSAAQRYNRELSLILFDIDRFKQINDTSGHAAGDAALKAFADTLNSTARAADIVCRFGGDEFAVILPETGSSNAWKFVERVIAKQNHPSVTAGVASLPSADLVQDADADLMQRKNNP